MESFVPFGGFFSTPSELKSSLSSCSSYPCISRCHICNERCEQEILAVSKGGFVASVADQYQSNLSPWLKMTELGTSKGFDGKVRLLLNMSSIEDFLFLLTLSKNADRMFNNDIRLNSLRFIKHDNY